MAIPHPPGSSKPDRLNSGRLNKLKRVEAEQKSVDEEYLSIEM